MKIEFVKKQPEFTPVQMVVNVETLEDARALYAIFNYNKRIKDEKQLVAVRARVWYTIFNHGRNARLLGKNDNADKLEKAVGEHYYTCQGEVIANSVTYDQYYK